jgi:hypothetical protein
LLFAHIVRNALRDLRSGWLFKGRRSGLGWHNEERLWRRRESYAVALWLRPPILVVELGFFALFAIFVFFFLLINVSVLLASFFFFISSVVVTLIVMFKYLPVIVLLCLDLE